MSKADPPITDMSSDDGFLTRWSRRKRDNAAAPQTLSDEPLQDLEQATAPEQPGSPEADAAKADAQAELDAVLAKLPSLESIGKDTDITGFLNALVPDAVRNAALRAAWSADPGIRDYLDDARDYALDYTATGNAPGFGPLGGTAEDMKAMIGQIFGDAPATLPERDKTLVVESPDGSREISDTESQLAVDAMQQPEPAPLAMESVRRTPTSLNPAELMPKQADKQSDNASTQHAASQHNQVDAKSNTSEATAFRRRGGAATPI
jgi:hypothetical protein